MDDEWPLLMKGDCLLSAVACGSSSQDFNFSSSKEFESTPNYMSLSTPQHSYTALDSTESSPFTETLPNSQKYLSLPAENNFTLSPYSTTTKLETREEHNYNQFVQPQCSPCSSTFSSSDQDALSIGFEKVYPATANDDVYGILLNVDDSLSLPADITPYTRSRYEAASAATTNDTLPPVSHFSNSSINQQSHNYTVTKCFTERLDSPSPPSSDCSSSLESPAPVLPCKARSKMHEMAVKQRLITDQDPRGNGFIQLSAEEKRTLLQEGYSLPTRLPLTKSEEDALKIVRRKIKNKLSAQESRRKRKEYMDTLEQRVQLYFSENSSLKAKIKQLEQSNRSLIVQLKKMQAAMNNANVVAQSSPPCLTAATHLPHNAAAADTAKIVNKLC